MAIVSGRFRIEHYRGNVLLRSGSYKNGVTRQGLSAMLKALFQGSLQGDNWFIGLINQSTDAITIDANDTLDNHPGWHEAAIMAGNSRLSWTPVYNEAVAQSNFNETVESEFVINENGFIGGAFLCNRQTVNDFDAAGILWSTTIFTEGLFNGVSFSVVAKPYSVQAGDTFTIFYQSGFVNTAPSQSLNTYTTIEIFP